MNIAPFVKWAGGKRQLLDKLIEYMPKKYKTYYEPFVGGGALLLKLQPKKAVINDFNKELMDVYKCLRNKRYYKKLVECLKYHEEHHSQEYFYQVRELDRHPSKFRAMRMYEKAARMIYLNKSCFNGLYRVSSKGYFNVPFNGKETVKIFDEANFENLHKYFHKRKPIMLTKDFVEATKTAKAGDFVYFDPPYDIADDKKIASFTSYTKNDFGKEDQVRLAEHVKELTKRGVLVMLSNLNTELIRELYKDFNIHIVKANRMINSKADGRGKVEEVIVTNY